MSTPGSNRRPTRGLITVGPLTLAACAADGSARSWVVGTSALSGLLLVAALLTVARPLARGPGVERRRVVLAGSVALAFQAAHGAEEYVTGFYADFPRLLGLPPWGPDAFLSFNLAWLLVWSAALVGVKRGWRIAEWPVWFLALALVANGVAHPLLALVGRRYFPGLVTAPLAGIAGLVLLRELNRSSRAAARRPASVEEVR